MGIVAHPQEARSPQDPVQVDRAAHVGDPVLGKAKNIVAARRRRFAQIASHAVELGDRLDRARSVGAVSLVIVVEVREVGEDEVGGVGLEDHPRGGGDPLGRADPGAGAPELESGNGPSAPRAPRAAAPAPRGSPGSCAHRPDSWVSESPTNRSRNSIEPAEEVGGRLPARASSSRIVSPSTRKRLCRQNITSSSRRKYQPFPTIPWLIGWRP